MKQRESRILELLSQHEKMDVAVLAETLGVSQVTVRKDLDSLERMQVVRREHGYAIFGGSEDLNNRLAIHYEEKRRIARAAADEVIRDAGRPVYGGTPADQSVVEAISALRTAGKHVVFYPFILMEQKAGNGLADPWTGNPYQPVLPWRGRIVRQTNRSSRFLKLLF